MTEIITQPDSPFRGFRMSIMPKADGGFRSSEVRIDSADAWNAANLRTRSGDILDFFTLASEEFSRKTGFPLRMIALSQFVDPATGENVLFLETVDRAASPCAFALRDALKPSDGDLRRRKSLEAGDIP